MNQEYDIFWKYHNKEDMDKQAVELIENQAKRIKELEDVIQKHKENDIGKVDEKICESWAKCREFDCPHGRPHKSIENGRGKCILHVCRVKPGYKICVDNK